MKANISRLVIAAAIAALAIVFCVTPVQAQVPNYPSGFSSYQICPSTTEQPPCSITVNGGPFSGVGTFVPYVPSEETVLRLTDDTSNLRGSAWFNIPQDSTNSWTTTFSFQLNGSDSENQGDGFAFVIQNSALTAIGGFGGGLGYGTRCSSASEAPEQTCLPDTVDAIGDTGIPKSVAIEFDTFHNGYDPEVPHIAVQSCGASPNVPDHRICNYGGAQVTSVNFADGESHTARIVYNASSCSEGCDNNLFIYLDGGTEAVLSTFINIAGKIGASGYLGFTAATRGAHETHDIVNWTFSPSQTQNVNSDGTTTFDFGNFDFTAKLSGGSRLVTVTPILKSQTDCNLLLQPNFSPAQCFVYDDAGGPGNPAAVMFEVTCPDTGNDCTVFDAELGTDYHFTKANNPNYRGASGTGNPLPGWLKGHPSDIDHPCNPNSGNTPPLFQSDQISSFVVVGDPSGTTKGKSGGTGSCWVATYNTPGVAPPPPIVSVPANGANYLVGSNVPSAFTCTAVNAAVTNSNPNFPTGPYLTVSTAPPPGCTAKNDGGAPVTSGTSISTTLGSHSFVANVLDSGSDTTSTTTINYNVVGAADAALLKLAPTSIATGKKITYSIGVGNLGPNSALNVTVKDPLPAGLSLTGVTFSASNVSCSLVNKKIVCTTINKTSGCSFVSPTVTCNVGTIVPLSLSPLNGATVTISATVNAAVGSKIKNTATVSADNDTRTSNNSSSASTTVTAH